MKTILKRKNQLIRNISQTGWRVGKRLCGEKIRHGKIAKWHADKDSLMIVSEEMVDLTRADEKYRITVEET